MEKRRPGTDVPPGRIACRRSRRWCGATTATGFKRYCSHRPRVAKRYSRPVRRHVVVELLTEAIREHALTREHFDRLIDARERDLDDEAPASLATLEDYAEATSAGLVYLALEILGAGDPVARRAAFHVGIAYALAGLLRAMPYRTRPDRGIVPPAIAAAASRHLDLARALRPPPTRAALPALLPAIVAAHFLRRFQRAGHDAFDPALAAPDPLQSWRLAAAALFNRF